MENSSSSSPDPAPPAALSGLEYVGFWKRFVAFLIDVFILVVITVPLLLAIYGRSYFRLAQEGGGIAGVWDFLLQYVLPTIAVIVFWRYRGATPGKMAISAKIVDAKTGRTPSTGKLVVRYFAYLVSMLPVFLGFVWIGIDKRKQGFHDKIAGTLVIYDND